jgi:hypothetical protein
LDIHAVSTPFLPALALILIIEVISIDAMHLFA